MRQRSRSRDSLALVPGVTLVLALSLGALLPGCQRGELERVRSVTYPPDFHYISQQEIHTTMGQLAAEVSVLEAVMEKEGGPQPEDRATVVAALERMDRLAAELAKGTRSNHPRIGADAPRLRETIDRALVSARTGSSSYYDVGRVVGGCMYCHSSANAPPREAGDRDPGPFREPETDRYRNKSPD